MSDKTIRVTVVMDVMERSNDRAVIADAIAALIMYSNTLPESVHPNWVKEISISCHY